MGSEAVLVPEPEELEVVERLLELEAQELGELLSAWLADREVPEAEAETRRGVLPDWVKARDLSETGWGVIFPSGRAAELEHRLHGLLEHRRFEAHPRYRKYEVDRDDLARHFLARRRVTPGAMVDPERLPYYLLIVGQPTEIPFEFQYDLNIHRAVGRLAFDDLDDYERYAEAVVEAERHGSERPRRATFFSVNNGDTATERLTKYLVQPLRQRLSRHLPSWPIDVRDGEQASKAALSCLLQDAPAFLMTASHGIRMRAGSRRQTARQGALLCQDWPGEGGSREAQYFHAGDLPRDVRLNGLIAVLAACYGAGTPRVDNFPRLEQGVPASEPQGLAKQPFVARLPQALLRQGSLAVVGHVDRLWTSSFCWAAQGRIEEAATHFEGALKRLLEGQRIGHALRPLAERSSRLAEEVNKPFRRLLQGREAHEAHLANLWTGYNDARNMILLGDPAVTIPRERPSKSAHQDPVGTIPHPRDPPPREPVGEHPAPGPGSERTLRLIVTRKEAMGGSRLVFRVEVSPEIEGLGIFEPFESKTLKAEPVDYFKAFFRDIESAAGVNVEEKLASYGVTVFEELIPESLRARLWKIREAIGTLQVISDESWIPWELMKLGSPDGSVVDDEFLGERYALTRWLSVAPHAPAEQIPLRKIAAVIPDNSKLPSTRDERAMLLSLDSSERDVMEIRPARFADVIGALGSGDYDGYHFSGHGSVWGSGADRWSIVLEDGDLTASLLSHRARQLGKTRPLVFVNTCSSASGELALTCAGGLAAGFLKQGAGAYLGTYWSVPDRHAAFFAAQFYRIFLDGETTLCEAVRRARLALRREFPNDPTWLAYTVFAHPLAVCGEALPELPSEPKPDGTEPDAPEPGPKSAELQLVAKSEPEPRQAEHEPAEEPRKTTSTQQPQSRWPKMTQNRAMLLAAVITAVATVIGAMLTVFSSPEGHELLVRVADRRSSAGILGAEVILFVEGGPFRATADSDGAAKLQLHLEGDPSGRLVAQAPGYEIIERTIQPLREKMVDLRLARWSSETAHALFRVVDGIDGKPVDGAEVLLLLGSDPHTQVTDSHGLVRFQVDFLEGKAEAQISVTTAEYTIEHQRITLLPDKVQDVVLDRQAGTLSPGGTGDVSTPLDREEIGQRLRRGQQWLDEGLLEKARVELESAHELDPLNPDVFLALAALEERAGNVGKAEEHYREALDLAPDQARYHHQLGNFLLSRRDVEEALRKLDKATEIDPENATAWNDLGLAYLEWNLLDEARSSFENGLLLLEDGVTMSHDVESKLRKNLGRTLVEAGEEEAAMSYLRDALREHSSDARFRFETGYLLARAYATTGQGKESCRHLVDFFHRKGVYSEWGSAAQELAQEQGCATEQEDGR